MSTVNSNAGTFPSFRKTGRATSLLVRIVRIVAPAPYHLPPTATARAGIRPVQSLSDNVTTPEAHGLAHTRPVTLRIRGVSRNRGFECISPLGEGRFGVIGIGPHEIIVSIGAWTHRPEHELDVLLFAARSKPCLAKPRGRDPIVQANPNARQSHPSQRIRSRNMSAASVV